MTVVGSQLWPPSVPHTLERQVWDSTTAGGLPGVARALQLYAGLISSCRLEEVRGVEVLGVPRLLEAPDPDMDRPTWVDAHVRDWWFHGNALHLVTARDARTGYPAACRYFPAHRWGIQESRDAQPIYLLDGKPVSRGDVVHAKRGIDPRFPYRGLGVVEQHLRTLNRAGLQEAAEAASLADRGTPSVAVITNLDSPDQSSLDAAAVKWVERFAGQTPRPAFFPKGTQVVPLSWTPENAQMVQARGMTTKDIANIFNLDGYWLGAEGSSHTYRSPGPMFLVLSKVSLGPVMDVLEAVWSAAWFPRGRNVRFDRVSLLRDDLLSMAQAFTAGSAYFPDPNEVRRYMGFPELPDSAWPQVPTQLQPPPAPEDEEDEETPA